MAAGVAVTCDGTTVAPGGLTTCASAPVTVTVTVTVTAAMIAGGTLTNTATARGDVAGLPVYSLPATGTAATGQSAQPSLELHKYARREAERVTTALVEGEKVTYSFTVVNTGNVRIDDVDVDDNLLGDAAVSCTPTTLPPGSSADCAAAPHTVTAEDVARTYVLNTATATGEPAQGPTVRAESSDSVRIPAEETGLDVVKTAEITKDDGFPGQADPGDEITDSFVVTNTSSAPAAVQVQDAMLAKAGRDITCTTTGMLEPGASTACTAQPYTVPADQAQGESTTTLTNTVNANAITAGNNGANGSDTATTPVAPRAVAAMTMTMGYTLTDVDGDGVAGAETRCCSPTTSPTPAMCRSRTSRSPTTESPLRVTRPPSTPVRAPTVSRRERTPSPPPTWWRASCATRPASPAPRCTPVSFPRSPWRTP